MFADRLALTNDGELNVSPYCFTVLRKLGLEAQNETVCDRFSFPPSAVGNIPQSTLQ